MNSTALWAQIFQSRSAPPPPPPPRLLRGRALEPLALRPSASWPGNPLPWVSGPKDVTWGRTQSAWTSGMSVT